MEKRRGEALGMRGRGEGDSRDETALSQNVQ
jgi:hypothetical protein